MSSLLDAAAAFADAGCSVVPASADGSKAPAGNWLLYQSQRPAIGQVRAWLGNGAYDGFGLVCGAVSGGLEMLEFEGRAVIAGLLSKYRDLLADHDLSALWERITSGYTEITPSGGVHILYRVGGTPRGNTKLARKASGEVLIETRGEGGFTIVAPSAGRTHKTGKPWELARGGPASIAVITEDERNALYAVASLLDEAPPPPLPVQRSVAGSGGSRPGDDFAAKTTWDEILAPHGWQRITGAGDSGTWRRPGKDAPGISATTREDGGLYVFSTSTPFDPEVPYTKFGAWALLNHDGDHAVAASQLRRDGYGEPLEHDDQNLGSLIAVAAESAQSAEWEPPAPLGGPAQLPAFPVDALPRWAARQVEAVASFTQTPADLPGTALLAVLSAAAGGRAVVEVRGSWREPVNLYALVALPSGARKSPVFAEMTGPLLDTELELVDKVAPVIQQSETERRIAQRAAEKAAATASGIEDKDARANATADAVAAAQLAEAITVPVMPRLIADDITSEAAASLLAEQGGRAAVLSAEGGIFATLAGRYSNGQPNFDVFLKGYSGDMLRVDRKGRPPEHIPHPALTLGLCLQPDVLRVIADLPGFRSRGLLARILYSLPVNLVGRREIGTPPVPQEVRDTYAASVRSLILAMAEWTDPAVLTLTPDAARLILDAERQLEPRLHPDTGDLAGIVDWASKQIGATVRVAALLHLAEHFTDGWARSVSGDTMQAALKIMDYFSAHALAVFDYMGVDQSLDDARFILRWLERTRPERFTKREAMISLTRSRFPKAGDLDAPLDLLEQHGYIRRLPEPERTGPGRKPSPAYETHPNLATESTQYTKPR